MIDNGRIHGRMDKKASRELVSGGDGGRRWREGKSYVDG